MMALDMDEAARLLEFARAAAEARLLQSTCGNASLLTAGDGFLISASGTELAGLRSSALAVVSLAGQLLSGPRPSVETALHRRIYELRRDARAVLHYQSPSATVLACMERPPLNLDYILEIPAYVRSFALIPFYLPGSLELAAAVGEAFDDPDVTIVQMRNHGQVAIGATWQEAIRRAIFFELASWLHLQGHRLHRIDPDQAEQLRRAAREV